MARRQWLTLFVMGGCVLASAHNGPPFRIISDQRIGPCIVSVWTHADVGTSEFFVTLTGVSGFQVPDDLRVEIALQPVNGRLPEKRYAAKRETEPVGKVQYKAMAALDFEGSWRVRVLLNSADGGGESSAIVEATPHGLGRWDLLLYMLPFLCIGLLWFGAVLRRRTWQRDRLKEGARCS